MDEQQIVTDHLREVAKAGGLEHYAEVGALIDLELAGPGAVAKLADLLGEICKEEHRSGRPMLSAIVVSKAAGMPGEGFFGLAKSLGLFDGADHLAFWAKEVERVHGYWKGAQPAS